MSAVRDMSVGGCQIHANIPVLTEVSLTSSPASHPDFFAACALTLNQQILKQATDT